MTYINSYMFRHRRAIFRELLNKSVPTDLPIYVLIVLISISIKTTLRRPVEYISYDTAGEDRFKSNGIKADVYIQHPYIYRVIQEESALLWEMIV